MKLRAGLLQALLDQAVQEKGEETVEATLQSLIVDSQTNVLTIVANERNHRIPAKYLRGEVFAATEGNMDISSAAVIEKQFVDAIRGLNAKLREKAWSKIYLIPTGHPALSAQLKLSVYRVTRMSTVDVFYYGGAYFDLDIDFREIE